MHSYLVFQRGSVASLPSRRRFGTRRVSNGPREDFMANILDSSSLLVPRAAGKRLLLCGYVNFSSPWNDLCSSWIQDDVLYAVQVDRNQRRLSLERWDIHCEYVILYSYLSMAKGFLKFRELMDLACLLRSSLRWRRFKANPSATLLAKCLSHNLSS